MELIETINYIIELPTRGFFLGLRIIFIILSIFLTAGIIYFLRVSDWLKIRFGENFKDFLEYRSLCSKSNIAEKWQKIKNKMEKSNKEVDYKIALIEAENFFRKLLTKREIKGDTLPEQLEKISPDILSSQEIEELLEAHKAYNNVIYDPDYRLSLSIAKKTVDVFEKIARERIVV